MKTRTKSTVLACGAALCALSAGRAQAELVELTNGQVLQGDVNDGQTNDDGLAVNVYDTGGTVVLRWDHIIESRRKQLRREHGIDPPEESVVLVPGHRVLLVANQEVVSGWSPNPRVEHEPLKMKTRNGTKEYDRSMLAGKVEDVEIDGLIVYSPDELYQILKDRDPPETPAAHMTLAQSCVNIGAFDHAKEHLNAAKADPDFPSTPAGKGIDAMMRLCEVMIRAKGASDLKGQITIAEHEQRWNEALKLFNTLDTTYKDDAIRKAIGYDLLEARLLKGRDTYFQREVARDVYRVMDKLIDEKTHERKPSAAPQGANAPADPPKLGSAQPGTLAAARQWENRELYKLLWERVAADLSLTADELEKYWKTRSIKAVRRAAYLSGSFIVVKRAPPPGQKPKTDQPRRAPPTDRGRGSKNVPEKPSAVEKPMTDEEWWEQVGPSDRARWLIANFVETSGMFEILRADQTNCADCGGKGVKTAQTTGGDEEQHFCKLCNGCGVFRVVSFR